MRGETLEVIDKIVLQIDFNPLPSCEGRRTRVNIRCSLVSDFNPLPSCEGRHTKVIDDRPNSNFNPLPSCEGRQLPHAHLLSRAHISIHSPHARGDPTSTTVQPVSSDFNPLPSCEGRRFPPNTVCRSDRFQSTPLMRGETGQRQMRKMPLTISIHSPHARGDKSPICSLRLG